MERRSSWRESRRTAAEPEKFCCHRWQRAGGCLCQSLMWFHNLPQTRACSNFVLLTTFLLVTLSY